MSASSSRANESGEVEGEDWVKGFETYAGFDAAGGPSRTAVTPGVPRFRSMRGLAAAVTVLLVLATAAAVCGLFADVNVFRLSGRTMPSTGFDATQWGEVDAARGPEYAASQLQLWATVVTAGFFIAWFHRARTNTEAFDPGACATGPGWAIGAWFVPLVNFVMPWLIARDMTRACVRPDPAYAGRKAPLALLNAWWIVWVSSKVLTLIGSRLPAADDETATAHQTAGVLIGVDVLTLAAALLAILYVRQLSGLQQRAYAGVTAAKPAERPLGERPA